MMRITAYSDRLLDDLDVLDWPEKVKAMQRNWIGRSTGASVLFAHATRGDIEVFTTRPDTLFGATYMVLAPEHELVDALDRGAVAGRRSTRGGRSARQPPPRPSPPTARSIAAKSDLERQENKSKTGVFLGAYATNPANGEQVPVFIADYVLVGYGTGAIMAVPGGRSAGLGLRHESSACRSSKSIAGGDISQAAYNGDGELVNSDYLNGLSVASAKEAITERLEADGRGRARVEYKLRDWLFARQRYWGEPFPIVYDADGRAHPLPESALPVELPDIPDYAPVQFDPDDADSEPSPPLAKATDWVHVELDLGDGLKPYTRDTNVMPQWAGSSWYELRYTDPHNSEAVLRQGERGVLDGPAAGRARPERPRRRRPVRRRRRARGAAPAVFAVLAQGALRPRPRQLARAVPPAGQPGLHPGVRLHRLARRAMCPRPRSSSATASSSGTGPTARSRSTRSSARSARA